MKHIFLAVLIIMVSASFSFAKDVFVKGYTRSDGTYVQPHHRSSPDSSRLNNYSTEGNVNPYTGQHGTVNPYSQPSNQNHFNNQYRNQFNSNDNNPFGRPNRTKSFSNNNDDD